MGETLLSLSFTNTAPTFGRTMTCAAGAAKVHRDNMARLIPMKMYVNILVLWLFRQKLKMYWAAAVFVDTDFCGCGLECVRVPDGRAVVSTIDLRVFLPDCN